MCLGRNDWRTGKPGKWQASRLISLTVDLPPALLPTLNPKRRGNITISTKLVVNYCAVITKKVIQYM